MERSSYTKDVTSEYIWNFELVLQSGFDVPVYVIVGFVERGQYDQEHQNKDRHYRPTVVIAQGSISKEKRPEVGITYNYAVDKESQAFGEIVSCFRHWGKITFFGHMLQKKTS